MKARSIMTLLTDRDKDAAYLSHKQSYFRRWFPVILGRFMSK